MRDRMAILAASLALAAAACSTQSRLDPRLTERPPLVVQRGDLEVRAVVTGELDAADSSELAVPRTQGWQVSIRYIAKDGAKVSEGDRLMEFDNSAVAERLRELELAVTRADNQLVAQEAVDARELAEKELEVERQRIAVAKAKIDAEVTPPLISRRQWQENALELERARSAHSSAVDALAAARRAAALERKVKQIDVDQARRALELAEAQLDALVLRAPHDGVLLVSDHPWFGRRLQVGDTVQPGMSALKVSSSATMKVVGQLSDVDDGRIARGMAADCVLDAYPDAIYRGEVSSISEIARQPDERSQRRFFEVDIALEETDNEVMRPGMSVRVDVLAGRVEGAVLAPRAGIDLDTNPPRARLAGGGERDIEIARCTAQICAISAGLEAGEKLRYAEGSP